MSDSSRGTYITILGTKYSVVSDRDEEYVRSLATYLNDQLERFVVGRSTPLLQRVILTALNIADELFRERERGAGAAMEMERRVEELIAMLDEHPESGPVAGSVLEEGRAEIARSAG